MEFKDECQSLGMPRTAKADDIKKAYRKLARQHHPDISKSADANERMVALNETNAVLSDPTKRLAYDSVGAGGDTPESADFSPPPHWDTGFEFSDGQADKAERSSFFEQLFSRAARSSRKQGHGKHFSDAMQGNDHHARSRCTSQETALGHLISIEDLGITASLEPSRAKRAARSAWPHA